PTHRNAWLNLGVVSADLGDRATAIRAWEQYLKLEPDGPHSASLRAQIEDMKRGSEPRLSRAQDDSPASSISRERPGARGLPGPPGGPLLGAQGSRSVGHPQRGNRF